MAQLVKHQAIIVIPVMQRLAFKISISFSYGLDIHLDFSYYFRLVKERKQEEGEKGLPSCSPVAVMAVIFTTYRAVLPQETITIKNRLFNIL